MDDLVQTIAADRQFCLVKTPREINGIQHIRQPRFQGHFLELKRYIEIFSWLKLLKNGSRYRPESDLHRLRPSVDLSHLSHLVISL